MVLQQTDWLLIAVNKQKIDPAVKEEISKLLKKSPVLTLEASMVQDLNDLKLCTKTGHTLMGYYFVEHKIVFTTVNGASSLVEEEDDCLIEDWTSSLEEEGCLSQDCSVAQNCSKSVCVQTMSLDRVNELIKRSIYLVKFVTSFAYILCWSGRVTASDKYMRKKGSISAVEYQASLNFLVY